MKHFVLLLHAGDYLDASRRRANGSADRYRHHSYALDSLARLVTDGARVSVIQMHSTHLYDEQFSGGIRFLGLGTGTTAEKPVAISAYLRAEAATHVMLRSPAVEVLRAVTDSPVRASVVLADSFPSRFRNRTRYRELGRLMGLPQVDFVSNHHLNSSRQLVKVLGVDPGKVVPWDWPLDLLEMADASAKPYPTGGELRLCYAGSITRIKGVWDAVEAVKALRERGHDASLDIAGGGQTEYLETLVERHGLRGHVTHRGRVGVGDILRMMRDSAFVCVPSRHSCPEGLPLTLYEAMASGTPIVASDHPMFKGVVRDGETGFVFRAGSPKRLASAVLRGWQDHQRYELVSSTAAAAYRGLGLDTLWGDIVVRWVRGAPEDLEWLRRSSLHARDRG